MLNETIFYICLVGLAGSCVGFFKNQGSGLKSLFLRLVDGCFSAYVIYEITFYYLNSQRISLALCAVGAFMGSDILVLVKDGLLGFLNRR